MPNNRRLLTIGAGLLVATAVLGILIQNRLSPLDRWALRDAHVEPGSILGQVATALSGGAVLVCVATLVTVVVAVWRQASIAKYALVLVACAAVALTQQVFQCPGPPVVAADWTYPSGHASVAAALAFTAIAIAVVYLPARRNLVTAVVSVAVVLTLISRVALGEHYVTDVIGALAGVTGVGLVLVAVLSPRPKVA